jgi:co-chaperonin GroES (HSP10)
MSINLQPLNEQVWVQPLAHDSNELYSDAKVGQQGVLTVIENQKAPSRGIVLAVGPGKRDQVNGLPIQMPAIKEGDIIRWTAGSAMPLAFGKQKMWVVAGSALLGIERVPT